MQPKTHVGLALRFFIMKNEGPFYRVTVKSVMDSKRNFARVFDRQNSIDWERIAERPLFGEHDFRVSELFVPQEAVISAADFISFVQRFFTFNPVKIITHDGGMTLPTLRSGPNLSVPVKVSGPATVGSASGHAHQLCP